MVAHCKVQGLSAVNCAETAEPIDLAFGLWRVGRRKHKFNRFRQVAPICSHGSMGSICPLMGGHIVNTIEPSVCGSDAALCQITLTNYFAAVTVNN